jgi:hypothetical protein
MTPSALPRRVARFFRIVAVAFLWGGGGIAAGVSAARAQQQPAAPEHRIVFQRGDALYVAGTDGRDVRRLFAIGRPLETLWAPAPDGRRVAWTQPLGGARAPAANLEARPVAVWIAELSGKRRKRLLSIPGDLRDRLGRKVTRLFIARAPGAGGGEDGTGSFDDWALDALAWSADGKSLYLSCTATATQGGRATFVVDAQTGAAVIDAQGRWKSIVAATDVDARGPLLVGVGIDRTADAGELPGPAAGRFYPLLLTDLSEGKTVSLLPGGGGGTRFTAAERPAYALAAAPMLSPDRKSVAFAAIGNGIYLLDIAGRNYRRLTDNPSDDTPRWSPDGKRVLFLSSLPRAGQVLTELHEIPVEPPTPASRRLVLGNVDRFFVVPE